jgi:hypothetical protein
MSKEIRELSFNELDAVSGAGIFTCVLSAAGFDPLAKTLDAMPELQHGPNGPGVKVP